MSSIPKKLLLIPAGFAVLLLIFWSGLDNDSSRLPSALTGQPLPAFQGELLNHPDQTISQEKLQQGVFLLNVWATWCSSCRVEHPFLLQLAQKNIAIIGINYKDDSSQAQQWLQQLGNPYRFTISDPKGDLGIELGVYGAPETFLVLNGTILLRHAGVLTPEIWQKNFKPLLQGAQS